MELVSQPRKLSGHLRTEIKGSRKRRICDLPATPFARLKACPQRDPAQIARLEKLLATLGPFELKEKIEQKLRPDFTPRSPLLTAQSRVEARGTGLNKRRLRRPAPD